MVSERAPALTEGLRILEIVAESRGAVPFEEILDKINMSRSSVSRLLKTLLNSGYIMTGPGKRDGYQPGVRFLSMVMNHSVEFVFMRNLQQKMDSLSKEHDVAVQYVIFDRDAEKVVVMNKAERIGTLYVDGYGTDLTYCIHRHGIGKTIAAFCTDKERQTLLSKCIPNKNTEKTILPGPELNFEFETIRQEEAGWDREESRPGIWRYALPVFNPSGTVHGAVGVSWIGKPADKEMKQVKNKLKELVELITLGRK